jgi:hypothetical protein
MILDMVLKCPHPLDSGARMVVVEESMNSQVLH